MHLTSKTEKKLESWARIAASILAISWLLGFTARIHWVGDTFSHFALQYAVGGLAFGIVFTALRKPRWVFLCAVIACANVYQVRHLMEDPRRFYPSEAAPNFVMVQYNKYEQNNNYGAMRAWLKSQGDKIDIVFVQESDEAALQELAKFKDLFPYQFPENEEQGFNDVIILSRHPFRVGPVQLTENKYYQVASRVTFDKESFAQPLTIYNVHTVSPQNFKRHGRRNRGLEGLAEAVRHDPSELIIASGDLNITPFSPYFADLLKTSGLRFQHFGFLPQTSWPSFTALPFLKIPIDHVLYKGKLEALDFATGPAMGSDHHAVVASFRVPEKE